MSGAKSRWNGPESKLAEQRILRSLKGDERKLYSELARKVSPEHILSAIGSRFSRYNETSDQSNEPHEAADQQILSPSNITDRCREFREETVGEQRLLDTGLDILIAVRKLDADLRDLQRVFLGCASNPLDKSPSAAASKAFFGHSPGVFWRMYEDFGASFLVDLDTKEKDWLYRLPLRQRYASEWEMIYPAHWVLRTEEGDLLMDHLGKCKATPCKCVEAKDRLNLLIKSTKSRYRGVEMQFAVCDALMRERSEEKKFGLVKAIADIYREVRATETARIEKERKERAEAEAKRKPDPGNPGCR